MSLAVRWGDPNNPEEPSGYIYLDAVTNYSQDYRGQVTKHPVDSQGQNTFGSEGQITILSEFCKGYSSRKFFRVICSVCATDPELFNDGHFEIDKFSLLRGSMPCGCSKTYKWNKDQYNIRCDRKAKELGYIFLGFDGDWRGHKTNVSLQCGLHGVWHTNNINHLMNGRGCPDCKAAATQEWNRQNKRMPDDEMIASFFASGAFHPDTKFWRDMSPNKKGHFLKWKIYCPECDTESRSSHPKELKLGLRPCNCTNEKQVFAYINILEDGTTPIALKFGITSNYKARLVKQKTKSNYEIKLFSLYRFPDVISCKSAEKECKDTLTCGVISRTDMQDGWTETTYLSHLSKIQEIYRKYGGVLDEFSN